MHISLFGRVELFILLTTIWESHHFFIEFFWPQRKSWTPVFPVIESAMTIGVMSMSRQGGILFGRVDSIWELLLAKAPDVLAFVVLAYPLFLMFSSAGRAHRKTRTKL